MGFDTIEINLVFINDINDKPYVIYEYVNMGVKRTVRISGLQPDVI